MDSPILETQIFIREALPEKEAKQIYAQFLFENDDAYLYITNKLSDIVNTVLNNHLIEIADSKLLRVMSEEINMYLKAWPIDDVNCPLTDCRTKLILSPSGVDINFFVHTLWNPFETTNFSTRYII